jgi:hypothetical protein
MGRTFYCCECGHGPLLFANHVACVGCEHKQCPRCEVRGDERPSSHRQCETAGVSSQSAATSSQAPAGPLSNARNLQISQRVPERPSKRLKASLLAPELPCNDPEQYAYLDKSCDQAFFPSQANTPKLRTPFGSVDKSRTTGDTGLDSRGLSQEVMKAVQIKRPSGVATTLPDEVAVPSRQLNAHKRAFSSPEDGLSVPDGSPRGKDKGRQRARRRLQHASASSLAPKLLVCPFWRHDPKVHWRCAKGGWKEVSRLK